MITIQYLEDSPDLPRREIETVREKLRMAARILPFTHLLIGWHLPVGLFEACRQEAEKLGLRLLRWHPLLTADGVFQPDPDCQVIGAGGRKVRGYNEMPEFTFVCPNNPIAQEEIRRRVDFLLKESVYDGFFLDRVRFPSPSNNPVQDLGCFCEHCCRLAAAQGFDLDLVRQAILKIAGTPDGRLALVISLLGGNTTEIEPKIAAQLNAFLDFRQACLTGFIARIYEPLHEAGMEIGLDCFSPGLTRMVGQDLGKLGIYADWIKVMSYAHTLGPAGIPFELSGFIDFLSAGGGLKLSDIIHAIGKALDLELPENLQLLKGRGISSSALETELRHGLRATSAPILAGVELVQIEGVAELNDIQILADLEAVRRADVAGLSISWDLWDIPLERLELVRRTMQGKNHKL